MQCENDLCRARLGPDDIAFRYRFQHRELVQFNGYKSYVDVGRFRCSACIDTNEDWWYPPSPCEVCGRGVRHENIYHEPFTVFCSEECRVKRDTMARTAKRRARREPRPCLVCRETFEPSRKDQVYCSTACRMRHHRAKLGGAGGGDI